MAIFSRFSSLELKSQKPKLTYKINLINPNFFSFVGETTTSDQAEKTGQNQSSSSSLIKKNDSNEATTQGGKTNSTETFQQRKEEAKSRRRKKKKTDSSVVATTFHDLYHLSNEILGQGAYASVRTCRNIWTDQEFAVKIIDKVPGHARSRVFKGIPKVHFTKYRPLS